jgi:hypothetical protein
LLAWLGGPFEKQGYNVIVALADEPAAALALNRYDACFDICINQVRRWYNYVIKVILFFIKSNVI